MKTLELPNQYYNWKSFLFWYFIVNTLVWSTFFLLDGKGFGIGNDALVIAPSIETLIHKNSSFTDPILRLYEARTDLFSIPFFGYYYPLYGYYLPLNIKDISDAFSHDLIVTSLHYLLSSFTFSLLLFRMNSGILLSILGGVFYAYSTYMHDWSSWVWSFSGYAWLPLNLLGVWLAVVERRYDVSFFLIAFATGMCALATSLMQVYFIISTATMYFASLAFINVEKKVLIKSTQSILFGGSLGMLIGASHILPSLSRSNEYIRWHDLGSSTGSLKPPYEATLNSLLDHWGGLHFLYPLKLTGGPLGTPFLGVILMTFALLIFFTDKKWRRFAIIGGVVSLIFVLDAMGDATFIHRIIYSLPIIGSVRYPVVGLIIPITFIIIFAIQSLKYINEANFKPTAYRCFILFLISILLASWFYSIDLKENYYWHYRSSQFDWAFNISTFATLIILLYLLISLRIRHTKFLVIGLLPLFTFATNIKLLNNDHNPYHECGSFSELRNSLKTWHNEFGKDARLASIFEPDGFTSPECMKRIRLRNQILDSIAMSEGWNVLLPYMSPRPYKEFREFLLGNKRIGNINLLHKMGVTHVLTNMNEQNLPESFVKVGETMGLSLYEVPKSDLSGNMVGCLKLRGKSGAWFMVGGKEARYISWDDTKLNYSDGIFCEKNTFVNGRITPHSRSDSGSVISYLVETDNNGVFLTTHVFNKNWDVYVNDKLVERINELDGYRMGVPVSSGVSKVKFVYNPTDYYIGVSISFLSFIVFIGLFIRRNFFRKGVFEN